MALTEAQWNRLQNSFPPEDRESYAAYLDAIGEPTPTPEPTPVNDNTLRPGDQGSKPTPTPTPEPVPTPTLPKGGRTGGPAPEPNAADDAYNAKIYAEKIATEAAAKIKAAKKAAGPGAGKKAYIWDDTGDGSWVKPSAPGAEALYDWNDETGWALKTADPSIRPAGVSKFYIYDPKTKTWVKPNPPLDDKQNTYIWDDDKGWVATPVTKVKTIVSTTYTGTGLLRKKITTYSDNTTETTDAPDVIAGTDTSGTGTTGTTGTGTSTGGFTQADIDKAVKASQDAATKAATDAAAAAAKTTARKNMIEVLYARFKNYGLETLAKKIEQLAIDGATDDTITLQLQETEEYKTRFKANGVRVKNDLKYLSPAEYLNLEDSYRQVLRAYGLKAFDNDAYVSQFIANDMSPTELSNRVVTAVQRVRNADPAVSKQLRDYYGIGQEDLVAYVLDPQQQFQKIERQVAASEIGVAAGRQGLTAGVTVAEQLAAQGITQAEAQKGYATIADILPGAEKLSNIYGNTIDVYGQAEGEQEVFNSLASAQRKRQKLSATEAGTFGASSGMNRTSLTGAKPAGQY